MAPTEVSSLAYCTGNHVHRINRDDERQAQGMRNNLSASHNAGEGDKQRRRKGHVLELRNARCGDACRCRQYTDTLDCSEPCSFGKRSRSEEMEQPHRRGFCKGDGTAESGESSKPVECVGRRGACEWKQTCELCLWA